MHKNVIITSANGKISGFLYNHWFKSLKDNVDLRDTDVVVIDYGISNKYKKRLLKDNVIIFKGSPKAHIVNKRFFDAKRFLMKKRYDQVLFIDGGDVIFQKDVSKVMDRN